MSLIENMTCTTVCVEEVINMKLTIINLQKDRRMSCFECKKPCTTGLTWDGVRVFRTVCDTCLKAYKSGIEDYFKNGASKKGVIVEKEESTQEEPEQYSEPTSIADDDE